MKKRTNILSLFFLLVLQLAATAQVYKPGETIEAFINNSWKKVTVIKPVTGKKGVYEVKEIVAANRGASLIQTVASDKLRFVKSQSATAPGSTSVTIAETKSGLLRLGRYEIYAGVPSIYIGHMILQDNGRYKVAFNTDEDNYDEMGRYTYHTETNTIEWQFGMFRNNNWGGKIVKKENGATRIEFTPTTYAELK